MQMQAVLRKAAQNKLTDASCARSSAMVPTRSPVDCHTSHTHTHTHTRARTRTRTRTRTHTHTYTPRTTARAREYARCTCNTLVLSVHTQRTALLHGCANPVWCMSTCSTHKPASTFMADKQVRNGPLNVCQWCIRLANVRGIGWQTGRSRGPRQVQYCVSSENLGAEACGVDRGLATRVRRLVLEPAPAPLSSVPPPVASRA